MTENFTKDEPRPSKLFPIAQLLDFQPGLSGRNAPLKDLSHIKWLSPPSLNHLQMTNLERLPANHYRDIIATSHSCLRSDLAQKNHL